MYITLQDLAPPDVYATLIQVVIPRPIAWVLSDGGSAGYNLAPYSFFNVVSTDPPMIFISAGRKRDGSPKDTPRNIEEHGNFVVHIVHRELAEAMVETSRTLPHGQSELERLDLALAEFEGFPLPRLARCRLALACELYEIHEVGPLPQALVFGKVRSIYVEDRMWEKDARNRLKIHADRIDPIGRLGGEEYVFFGELIRIPRPR